MTKYMIIILFTSSLITCRTKQENTNTAPQDFINSTNYSSTQQILLDFSYGDYPILRDSINYSDIINCITLNRLADKKLVSFQFIKPIITKEFARYQITKEKDAFIDQYFFSELNLNISIADYLPQGIFEDSLPDSLKSYIIFNDSYYDINKDILKSNCGFIFGFSMPTVHLLTHGKDKYILLQIHISGESQGISLTEGPIQILFGQNGLINLPVIRSRLSKLSFNDFNKDGQIDYIYVNRDKKKIELYTLKENNFFLNKDYYISFTEGKPNKIGHSKLYLDSLNTNWFGPNNSIFGIDAILKDTIFLSN